MRTWIAVLGACLLLTACGRQEDPRINQLETQVAAALEAKAEAESEVRRLNGRIRDLQDKLQEAEERGKELRAEAGNTGSDDEIERLEATIAEQESEIERLSNQIKQLEETVEVPEEATEPREEPNELTPEQIERKMAELMPLLRAGDRDAINDLMATARQANRETRDEIIQRMRDWVNDAPEDKHARLALASALTTRFQDLDDPMQQGALAGEVKDELEKATEIDPDYYEARHILAILRVNYPPFAPEFKEADKALDKALELQKDMAWEDRFADIYSAYSLWYRKQGQLDDAAGWVRKGLDKAPRNEGLLAEQESVEEARTAEEE